MKKLGTLYGKDILIDTDDERIAAMAGKHISETYAKAHLYVETETKQEADNFGR